MKGANEMDNLALTCAKRRIELAQKHFPAGLTPEMIRLMDDVQELLSKAYIAGYQAAENTTPEQWSNQAAFGYAIIASKRIGLSENDKQRLVRSLNSTFDEVSLEVAAECYRKSPY
jgi:hypothetical protein